MIKQFIGTVAVLALLCLLFPGARDWGWKKLGGDIQPEAISMSAAPAVPTGPDGQPLPPVDPKIALLAQKRAQLCGLINDYRDSRTSSGLGGAITSQGSAKAQPDPAPSPDSPEFWPGFNNPKAFGLGAARDVRDEINRIKKSP